MSQNPNASKNSTLFFGAIVVAIIAIALVVYYLIPMDSHILASGADKQNFKHAMGLGALAILAIIAALVTRPKRSA